MAEDNPVQHLERLVTIGVYGTDAKSFFKALEEAEVDTFCDIRHRRGMRGREYAFANSARLQEHLRKMGIRYLHFRDAAPTPKLLQIQTDADKAHRVARRKRIVLSGAFIRGFNRCILDKFNSRAFAERFGPGARVVALFCVEREPTACHRSLLAGRLAKDLGLSVEHIVPGKELPNRRKRPARAQTA